MDRVVLFSILMPIGARAKRHKNCLICRHIRETGHPFFEHSKIVDTEGADKNKEVNL